MLRNAADRRRSSPPGTSRSPNGKPKRRFGYRVTDEVHQVAAHAGSSQGPGERGHPAADGHRDALRADQGRGDHHHRRGPASDVGRPVLSSYKFPRQFLTSAGLGAMGYGYPAALGAKVACPGQAGHRYRRRRLVPHERPGTRHRAHREDRRQSAHPEQPAPRHGGAVGRPLLRRATAATPTSAIRKTASRFIRTTSPWRRASTSRASA